MDDETRLAREASRGDPRALEALVRATQADVWRFCAFLGDRRHADDLTQETYARALRALPSFRGDSSVKTWLFGIARHVCADHVRAEMRRERLHDRLERSQSYRSERDTTEFSDIWMQVKTLPEKFQSALVLTQVLGLSYGEAAEVCEVPVGTIRSRVARAREALLDEPEGHSAEA